jgi:plastocyanin
MPLNWPININKNKKKPPRITFDPNPLGPPDQQVAPGDEIFWANNDSKPHWPARCDQNGNITNQAFFMPNQIAAHSTSSTFIPTAPETMYYVCSLHPDEKLVVGKIDIVAPQP